MEHRYALGIDIGGTFTDLVAHDERTNGYFSYKELTTHDDPTRGVASGILHLFENEGLDVAQVGRVVHATTLFTNALIERRGAVTGLITTEGFRDVLEIGRERKYELYDIFIKLPVPLVRRQLRREVAERMTPEGQVERALDLDGLLHETRILVEAGVTSLAIAFLHSYANPDHERAARAAIEARYPELAISLSSDVAPQIREYERTSTTVANAYVKPLAAAYLGRLNRTLKDIGIASEPFLMLSNGGFTNLAEASRNPIQMLESGPAAGALAGAYFGLRSDCRNVLAFDMGGTTAKLSVIDDAAPHVVHRFEAGREMRFIEGSGLPMNISTVELIEIGAGGGSLARVNELGLLKVGPQSAGSMPGPACYGRGGTEPTVTDANLVLGYLDPDFFAGGSMSLSLASARAASDTLTEATGLGTTATAWGIYNLVNETMAGAARVHVSERGQDARDYVLLTTGGGGPLHGCEVARKLGIDTIVCPPSAGVASALGLLMAPTRIDRVLTVNGALDELDFAVIEDRFGDLERAALAIVRETGIDPREAICTRFADMRYRGQGFELVLELPEGPYRAGSSATILACFEAEYRKVYGRLPERGQAEVVNIRVCVQARTAAPDLQPRVAASGGEAALKGVRRAYFSLAGEYLDVRVFDRAKLAVSTIVDGPALIEEPESTLLLPPRARAQVETGGNIVVTLG